MIRLVYGTPGSGMSYVHNKFFPLVDDPSESILLSLSCACCGEDVYQDNLCRDCFESLRERD